MVVCSEDAPASRLGSVRGNVKEKCWLSLIASPLILTAGMSGDPASGQSSVAQDGKQVNERLPRGRAPEPFTPRYDVSWRSLHRGFR